MLWLRLSMGVVLSLQLVGKVGAFEDVKIQPFAVPFPETKVEITDIYPVSDDDIWVTTTTSIYHFKGGVWKKEDPVPSIDG